MIMRKKTKLF